MSREPRGLQGRTLGGGRLVRASVAGEFARVARLYRARMSGQAFLVLFCGGGLPPFDKRDSPEGAKPETSEHSERRATPKQDVSGLFPFGPAQALFAMEPRPAFAGMTGLGGWCRTSKLLRTAPSPYGERVGERALLTPAPQPPATPIREQARSYKCQVPPLNAPKPPAAAPPTAPAARHTPS